MTTKALCTAAAAAFTICAAPAAQAYVLFGASVNETGSDCAQNAKIGVTQKHCDFMLETAKARYEEATKVGIAEAKCKEKFAECVAAPQGGFRPKMNGAYVNVSATYSGRVAAFFQYHPQAKVESIEQYGGFPTVKMNKGGSYTLTSYTGWEGIDAAVTKKPEEFKLKFKK